MKRYLVFAGEYGLAKGGGNDLRAQVETIAAAEEWFRYNKRSYRDAWCHILDCETGRICLHLTWQQPNHQPHIEMIIKKPQVEKKKRISKPRVKKADTNNLFFYGESEDK